MYFHSIILQIFTTNILHAACRPPLGPTRNKAVDAWNWPLTSNSYGNKEYVVLYLHSSIRLQDIDVSLGKVAKFTFTSHITYTVQI
jgi:hypothetical protein